MSKKLSPTQIKYLRGLAHGLNPIVTIGNNGVTESVLAELDRSLAHHELLKVKIAAGEREDRKVVIDYLIQNSGASLVQAIGKTVVLYRAAQPPELELPKK
ncbi:ribosome assembly RNA-binding protein YhbY [Galenea microaerophila]